VVPYRLLRVVDPVVAGEKDYPGIGKAFGNAACELESVDERHTDVGENDIGPVLLDRAHRLLPVRAYGDQLETVLFPFYAIAHPLADGSLIVGNSYAIHRGYCTMTSPDRLRRAWIGVRVKRVPIACRRQALNRKITL